MFSDSKRFLNSCSDKITSLSNKDAFKILETDFGRIYKLFFKRIGYPYDYVHEMEDYGKPTNEIEKKQYSSTLDGKISNDKEIEWTNTTLQSLNL